MYCNRTIHVEIISLQDWLKVLQDSAQWHKILLCTTTGERQSCLFTPLQFAKVGKRNFKIKNESSPPVVRKLFYHRAKNYNLIDFSEFGIRNVVRDFHNKEIVSFLAQKVWGIVTTGFSELISLSLFKKTI